MTGVPLEYTTAHDFMGVRAALVRHVGGGNQALVFTRIDFRCGTPGNDRIEDETGRWWRAQLDVLSTQTGLTVSAVRTALKSLTAAGFVEERQHHVEGAYDHSKSYRPIIANRSARSDKSDLLDLADPSISKEVKTLPTPPAPEEDKQPGRADADALCDLLATNMVGNGCKKPTITKAWRTEARLLIDKDQRPAAEAQAVLAWSQQDDFWKTNIHSIPKFRAKYDQLRMRWQASGGSLAPTAPQTDLRGWLQDMYRRATVRPVEERTGAKYHRPDPPDDAVTAEQVADWLENHRREWIAEQAKKMLGQEEAA